MSVNNMIQLVIDGVSAEVTPGTTILNAAEQAGIEIPTLCYLKNLAPDGSCRLCVVEVRSGARSYLAASCTELCADGMEVRTRSALVAESRRFVLDLLLSRHLNSCFSCERAGECRKRLIAYCNYDKNCFTCDKHEDCKLRRYCMEYGVFASGQPDHAEEQPLEEVGGVFVYDPNRCILCRRCQRTCESQAGYGILTLLDRGADTRIGMPGEADAGFCASCGACVEVCPTGALSSIKHGKTGA